jgi:hypothetical protein
MSECWWNHFTFEVNARKSFNNSSILAGFFFMNFCISYMLEPNSVSCDSDDFCSSCSG